MVLKYSTLPPYKVTPARRALCSKQPAESREEEPSALPVWLRALCAAQPPPLLPMEADEPLFAGLQGGGGGGGGRTAMCRSPASARPISP